MPKKLLTVWLSLTILLFSSISIYAEESVQGEYFNKDIVINGENIENYMNESPFILYKNLTYMALTPEMSNILGINWDMNLESRTLTISKKPITQKNFVQQWMKHNQRITEAEILPDVRIILSGQQSEQPAADPLGISLEEVMMAGMTTSAPAEYLETSAEANSQPATDITENLNQDVIDNTITTPAFIEAEVDMTNYQVLTVGEVFYMPISAITSVPDFGWDVYYEAYSGIYLRTDGLTTAKETFNEPESRFNRGLVNYLMSANGKYTVTQAQNLIFTIKREAKVYKVDPLLVMAIAHKESTFNASAKSSAGALGFMQVMPATGAHYGLSKADLLDAHKSIEFGTLYIKERIDAYEGSYTKALSAYNQGSASVNRGGFSTRYADQVQLKLNKINSYLDIQGYGTGL
jgi:hypothetical protein